jgi:RHS repeat-associated protein
VTVQSFPPPDLAVLALSYQVDIELATGAASVTVPIPTTRGRGGFGPSLTLRYDSSAGNSAFGLGWSLLGVPSVTVDDRRRFASYDPTDGYLAGGAELVPAAVEEGGGWRGRSDESAEFLVSYFRSKYETTFIRFERWTEKATGDVHWRARTGDGHVTIFGRSHDARIGDPADPSRVYAWLAELQLDEVGNAIAYEYTAEDLAGVDVTASYERQHAQTQPQRYLKQISYANSKPFAGDAEPDGNRWRLRVVFDYGDHPDDDPPPAPSRAWATRPDPHSTHRPGFELRTYRLCRRVLVFHDFPELGDAARHVQSLALEHDLDPAGSVLRRIRLTRFRRDGDVASSKSVPQLELTYSEARVGREVETVGDEAKRNLPEGLAGMRYRWVDLYGEALPGVLTETDQAWYYKPNLGGGRFGPQELVTTKPGPMTGAYAVTDFDRDGNLNLVVLSGGGAGYCEYDRERSVWSAFTPFPSAARVDELGRQELVDLDGDGLPDIVVSEADRLVVYRSEGKEGFASPVSLPRPDAGRTGTPSLAERTEVDVFFADMCGDGALDVVRIENGRVEYWPHLGNGRFGDAVAMADAPVFDAAAGFDASRIRFADLDGSGTTDLLYIGRGDVRWWINASGNRFVEGGRIGGLPQIDNLATVQVLDFLGDGSPCFVWSSPLAADAAEPLRYVKLDDGTRPRLLLSVSNSMGSVHRLTYSTSSAHYLRDKLAGKPWLVPLPTNPVVVDRLKLVDEIGGTSLVSRYEYHEGAFDGEERVFRGFALVDRYDVEALARDGELPPLDTAAPSCTRVWHHTGAYRSELVVAARRYTADPAEIVLAPSGPEHPEDLDAAAFADAYRALSGQVVREERYEVLADGSRATHPYSVTQVAWSVRLLQPTGPGFAPAYFAYRREAVSSIYEQEPGDPRETWTGTLEVDAYGLVPLHAEVGLPRRGQPPDVAPAQGRSVGTASGKRMLHVDTADAYRLGAIVETVAYHLHGLAPGDPAAQARAALAAPKAFHEALDAGQPQARVVGRDRSFYWNDARDAALPLGQLGSRVLPHHDETAVFTTAFVGPLFGARMDSALLSGDCRYVEADGHWWQRHPIRRYAGPDGFFALASEERVDGGTTTYTPDAHVLATVETTDAVGNRMRQELDYHTLSVARQTDANGNVEEAQLDALGSPVVAVARGHVAPGGVERPYGSDPLTDYVRRPEPAGIAAVFATPANYLQHADQFVYYDLDAWTARHEPPCLAVATGEQLVHDGDGGGTAAGLVQLTVYHLDGLGRILQAKERVEPGPAVARDGQGKLQTDAEGVPVEAEAAERWRASAHVVRDRKQQTVLEYEPFFTTTAAYEADPELQAFGAATRFNYDALGRLIRTEAPDGTFTRASFAPWSFTLEDANDTVDESLYKARRQGLSADDPARQALAKAEAHAGTPLVVQLDPFGREIAQVERLEGGGERRTLTELDADGNTLSVTDPRGLVAVQYDHGMTSGVLRQRSIDAGESLTLPDALGHPIHSWDGRGAHHRSTYDRLGRLRSIHVDGALGLDHLVEQYEYGDDPAAPDGEARNVRGRLVRQRDAAGVTTVAAYTPGGAILQVELQLRTEYKAEPNWSAPGGEQLEAASFTTEYRYDALDRTVRQTLADGTTRAIVYGLGGGVGSVTVGTVDASLPDTVVVDRTAFDARGHRASARLGNGVTVTHDYDRETSKLQRLRSVLSSGGGDRTIQDVAITRDPVGNVTHLVDQAQQPAAPTPLLQGLTVSSHFDFTYDALYRLTEATGRVHQALLEHDYRNVGNGDQMKGTRHLHPNNGAAVERYTRTYSYDLSGNITRVRHQGPTHSWTTDIWTSPTSNRSLPANDPNGNPVANREAAFDANGNTTFLPHLKRMEWSHRDTLSRAVVIERADPQPDDAEYYVYDAGHLRVRRATERLVDGQVEVTEKIYLDDCEIKRIRRNGATILERRTSHVTDGANRIALLHRWSVDAQARETDDPTATRFHYQLQDHLGSSVIEVDEHGALISYEEYFPFGGTAFIAGPSARQVRLKDYRYTGKECDDVTGLYYFEYRYYAPWIGNWLSPDPTGPGDSLNLYEFVRNNPINLVDPNGLQATGDLVQLAQVNAKLNERQVINLFNRTVGLERGIRVLDLEQRGKDWIIVDYVRIDPRRFETLKQAGPGTVDLFLTLEEMAHRPPPDITWPGSEGGEVGTGNVGGGNPPQTAGMNSGDPTAGGETQTNPTGADGQNAGSNSSPSSNNRADSNNVHDGDGNATAQHPGQGTGVNGNGQGAGGRGSGRGGGGQSEEAGRGTQPGGGPGAGASGNGPGASTHHGRTGTGNGGAGSKPGQSGGGKRPGAGGHGSPQGSPQGSPDGVPGGSAGGSPGGVEGGKPGGVPGGDPNGVPGGDPSGSEQGSPQGAPGGTSTEGSPTGTGDHAGQDMGDTNANGNPGGDRNGRTGAQGQDGQGSGAQHTGGGNGANGSGSGSGSPQRQTTLDRVTRWAGYWNLEFSGDPNGVSGGIPGGMGWISGWGAQVAYIGLTVVDIVMTVITLGELKAAMGGLKAGLRAALTELKNLPRLLKNVVADGFRAGAARLARFASEFKAGLRPLAMAGEHAGGGRAGGKLLTEATEATAGAATKAAGGEAKLFRFGLAPESAQKLAADAAAAEATGRFPHGVSTFSRTSRLDAASALRSEVEKHFKVTKTGGNAFHYTVELPKPVTEEVAKLFNTLFGRGGP